MNPMKRDMNTNPTLSVHQKNGSVIPAVSNSNAAKGRAPEKSKAPVSNQQHPEKKTAGSLSTQQPPNSSTTQFWLTVDLSQESDGEKGKLIPKKASEIKKTKRQSHPLGEYYFPDQFHGESGFFYHSIHVSFVFIWPII